MRKIAFTVILFSVLILFVPSLFVVLSQKWQNPAPIVPDKNEPQLSASEPIQTITAYVVDEDKVVEMDFTEYIKGVVAAEMPANFHDEALKAQAVAARSYILTRMLGYERDGTPPEHNGAITCTSHTHCQAWLSKEKANARWGPDWADTYWAKISKNVEATRGIVMTYNGEPVNAVFHSTSSGKTENSKDVWGGDVPYLVSVDSPGDELSPKYQSVKQINIDEFKQKIQDAYPSAAWNEGDELIESIARSDAGGIISLTTGGITLKPTELRNLFELPSANVEFHIEENTVTMNTRGNGHGVGMSQYGANYLASQGMDYINILKTYYTGVEVGVWKQ